MYIDKATMVSNAQVVTVSAGSTDYIDLGAGGRDLGIGQNAEFLITCDAPAAAAGAATVNVQLQCDDNAAFSSPKTVAQTGALAKTVFVQGYQTVLVAPIGLNERYVRAYFEVLSGPLTTGAFTVAVADQVQISKAYPQAF